MYTERDEIAKQDESTTNKYLYNLVNGGHYNELLALANLIYIPGQSTDSEKEYLLRESGVLDIQQEYEGLSDEYKITRLLDKISLMTPENIHINTFMYEPLIDMSIIHLVKLYELVKSEKDRIEQLQFNG